MRLIGGAYLVGYDCGSWLGEAGVCSPALMIFHWLEKKLGVFGWTKKGFDFSIK